MSETPEYIQIDAGEDLASVRDRLSFIRGRPVLLIWPESGTALQRKLDLVLVQREARRRAIRLALVTHDERVIHHARELNISTFETIKESRKTRWKRGRTRVFARRDRKPERDPEPEALMPHASRVRAPRRRRSLLGRVVLRLGILILVLGLVAGVMLLIVPGATVRLALLERQLEVDVTVIANPEAQNVNIERGVIPATVLRVAVDTTGTMSTTGERVEEGARATGTVVFTNQTADALTIPANTTLSTSAGTPIVFQTTAPVTLAAGTGQRAEAPIQAMQASAGGVGNVDTGLINTVIGPLENDVTVRNFAPTSGGEARRLPLVTQRDRERLLANVRGQLQSIAFNEMRGRISETSFVILETIRISEERGDWTTYSHDVGAVSPTLTLTMRAVVEAVAIDERFARQIAFARLSAEKPRGLVLVPESVVTTRGAVADITPERRITFNVRAEGITRAEVDLNRLRRGLAGRTPAEAAEWLALETALAPDVSPQFFITPEGFPRLPLLAPRISLEVMPS